MAMMSGPVPSVHAAWQRTALRLGGEQVVVGVGAPAQVDGSPGGRRLAELEKAAVAELLLTEIGCSLAYPILQSGQRHRPISAGNVENNCAQQGERRLLVRGRGG